jgi:hypothetical protein
MGGGRILKALDEHGQLGQVGIMILGHALWVEFLIDG